MILLLLTCVFENLTNLTCTGELIANTELNWWAIGFTALITGGAVVGGIFLTQLITSSQIKKRNSKAILSHVHNVIDALGNFHLRRYTTYDGWNICYVSHRFPLTPYQSIINSGEFTHFSNDSQGLLTTFLYVMEERNRLLKEIEEIYRIFEIKYVRNWRNLKEEAELKELTVTNGELYLLNELLPRLLSAFGSGVWDHEFFT